MAVRTGDQFLPDPEAGEPINASHLIPRSRADIERRRLCLERIAEHSVGPMGRSPDYMNVTFAGFAGLSDERGACGNEVGAANLIAFQKRLRRQDFSLTHTIIHPTIDKVRPDIEAGGASAELRVRVFRLAGDFAASALGSRNEQYERFYLASGARNRVLSHLFAPKERSPRLVEKPE